MAEIIFITILGEILLPLALLAWLWRGSCDSRVEWLLKTVSLAAYLLLIAVAGIWLLVPWYLPYGIAALGFAAASVAWGRCKRPSPVYGRRFRTRFRVGWHLVLALFCSGILAWALLGHQPPAGLPAAGLASPVKNGTFYVVNGGYSILINPHMKTLTRESLAGYRAQSYALDIVRIDRFGRRAEGLWPLALGRYYIFGEPVYAPCSGVVARAEDGQSDRLPPEDGRHHPAGNFVLLECDEYDVLLAHLMHASLRVQRGERVQTGQWMARVGNSGLSTEPHLHLHVQRRSSAENFLDAEPLPVRVEGRILVRNSRLFSRD
jgi:hypothetical protein